MSTVLMFVRHGEKPLGDASPRGVTIDGQPDRESLTPRGWQRAGALVRFFVAGDGGPGSSGLPVPTRFFASQVGPQSSSRRPLETLQPLAERLRQPVDATHLKQDVDGLSRTLAAVEGSAVVSWEHHLIPSIVLALVESPGPVPSAWPDDRFDVVWVLERPSATMPFTFRQVPQLLLAGDVAELIVDLGAG